MSTTRAIQIQTPKQASVSLNSKGAARFPTAILQLVVDPILWRTEEVTRSTGTSSKSAQIIKENLQHPPAFLNMVPCAQKLLKTFPFVRSSRNKHVFTSLSPPDLEPQMSQEKNYSQKPAVRIGHWAKLKPLNVRMTAALFAQEYSQTWECNKGRRMECQESKPVLPGFTAKANRSAVAKTGHAGAGGE